MPTPTILTNWIDNKPCNEFDISMVSDLNTFIPVQSPATGTVVAYCPLSSKAQVEMAVDSSFTAFQNWSSLTVKSRVAFLIRFHQLVIKHSDTLADLIVLEHGKTKNEALAEIAKGNETVEYALSMPQLIQGKVLEVSRGVVCHDIRKPVGVTVSIVPFNFPFMVPFWTLPIAIACGNTFILKPSEKVPLTMFKVMELFKEAGLPQGVVNLVNGSANTVNYLCEHPKVKAVTFVGTSHVASIISQKCSSLNKKVLALGGAKNHLVAAKDCHVEMTALDVVNSFTGCAGQRCMAASVLLTIGSQKELIASIIDKATSITPGQSSSGHMGPIIDQQSLNKIIEYIKDAESGGATVLLDGRSWLEKSGDGFWIGPTIIKHQNISDKALHDEIFGPVVSIYECTSHEEAIEIENANPYGNAACIYTTSGACAEWFSKRFSAGMIGINIGVPVPREPFSFGGINNSKFGDSDITGDGAIEFYTMRTKVTTKWTPPTEKSWLN